MRRSSHIPMKPFVLGDVYNGQSQSSGSTLVYPKMESPNHRDNSMEFIALECPEKSVNITVVDSKATENADKADGTSSIQKVPFKDIFVARKKSSVRAKERKIRQNRQLRRAILPKNALMALNEVKGITIGDFVINSQENGFTAILTVNSKQYQGYGISKAAAKNSACEKALRDYVIEKMQQKPRISKIATRSESIDTSENNDSDSHDSLKVADDDDVPMVNLASFALYKLFSEWENEGFVVPEMHPESQNDTKPPSVKEPKKPSIRTQLPANWETMHPAALLCLMRPGLSYTDVGSTGEKQNMVQTVSVVVDERKFIGSGRSKKIARRNTAAAVCNELFGTNFTLFEESQQINNA